MNGQEAYNHIKVTYGAMVLDHLIFKALRKAREATKGTK